MDPAGCRAFGIAVAKGVRQEIAVWRPAPVSAFSPLERVGSTHHEARTACDLAASNVRSPNPSPPPLTI